MKHKHYDMIVTKAANMELVVFVKLTSMWSEMNDRSIVPTDVNFEYFLCLPQHKEACLHWLNGGKSQAEYTKSSYPYWCDIDSDEANWSDGHIFMDKNLNIRIKQKKEKRWIGYCASRNQTIPHPQDSEQLAMNYTALHYSYHVNEWQFIEIEVEV